MSFLVLKVNITTINADFRTFLHILCKYYVAMVKTCNQRIPPIMKNNCSLYEYFCIINSSDTLFKKNIQNIKWFITDNINVMDITRFV